ncbi:hypothetical protein ACH5RR_034133 [Cinchona calisaya]|uniref:Uncharacterized protein n=1 Tax=Cinchona calisaya TaxID=153742 RepID=A0ABD2YD06_9GENT
MDDNPIDVKISVPSRRKYRKNKSHGQKNSRADYLKRRQKMFKTGIYLRPVDADEDFVQYLTGKMISTLTEDNCEGVNDNAVDNDPQHEIVLDNLKEDGNSNVLEVSGKSRVSDVLKYDREDKSDDELDKDTQGRKNNLIGGNVRDDRSVSSRGTKHPKVLSTLPENQGKKSVVENVSISKNTANSMKGNPDLLVDAEQSDPSVEEGDRCQDLGSLIRERRALFRKQVMGILRKPYDEKEHQILLEDIRAKKQTERNINIQVGSEQANTIDKDGKSYLDHYYDFRRKFQAAKSSQKELILLRGFFFWLQNLSREGAFKPWLDKTCLALLAQTP